MMSVSQTVRRRSFETYVGISALGHRRRDRRPWPRRQFRILHGSTVSLGCRQLRRIDGCSDDTHRHLDDLEHLTGRAISEVADQRDRSPLLGPCEVVELGVLDQLDAR